MNLKEATKKLQEMHIIEERLLEILSAEGASYSDEDLKQITTRIFEVVDLIMRLTVLIHQARQRGDKRL
tara:strand:+ start:287 stop:493 length:207 start_codon:yes stop_codon:yes gene_type:complete